jgi:hypothetical protein
VAVLVVGPELLPIQGFTQDPAVLKEAVRRALEPNPKAGDPDVQALYSLVQWLKDQPGRKAAILFSSGLGVPSGFEDSVQDVQALANRYRISFYGVDPRGVEMAKAGIRAANQESEGISSELWGMGGQSRIGGPPRLEGAARPSALVARALRLAQARAASSSSARTTSRRACGRSAKTSRATTS